MGMWDGYADNALYRIADIAGTLLFIDAGYRTFDAFSRNTDNLKYAAIEAGTALLYLAMRMIPEKNKMKAEKRNTPVILDRDNKDVRSLVSLTSRPDLN